MHSRLMLIVALTATLVAPAGAEPGKGAPAQANQPANRPAEILLASADVRSPDQTADAQPTEGQAPAPVKRPRAARVTTCRCGGQTPQNP